MKTRESGCINSRFLDPGTSGGEWSASRPGHFSPGKRPPPPGTHWIGGWVGPRIGLDDVEKRETLPLPGLELRPLGRPARRQSLYRLSYPGFIIAFKYKFSSGLDYII
jgi:hypothetical protein